jgi:hypothetical protein
MKILSFIIAICLLNFYASSAVVVNEMCKYDKNISDFPFVGGIYNLRTQGAGTASIIGKGRYVITARHCVTSEGQIEGDTEKPENLMFITNTHNYRISDVYACADSDIAICKLATPSESYVQLKKPIKLMLEEEFYGAGVGKGCSTVSYESLNFDLPYGTLRIFKNAIQGAIVKTFTDECKNQHKFILYYYVLRDPKSPLGPQSLGEGMHGPGDSGGGLFVFEDDALQLFAIISSIVVESPITGFAADVGENSVWIRSIVPDAFDDSRHVPTLSMFVPHLRNSAKTYPSPRFADYTARYVIADFRRVKIVRCKELKRRNKSIG